MSLNIEFCDNTELYTVLKCFVVLNAPHTVRGLMFVWSLELAINFPRLFQDFCQVVLF